MACMMIRHSSKFFSQGWYHRIPLANSSFQLFRARYASKPDISCDSLYVVKNSLCQFVVSTIDCCHDLRIQLGLPGSELHQ